MIKELTWQYDEFTQVGKDYTSPAEVEIYDARHADFRDLTKESRTMLDLLAIQPHEVLIDLGAGTGTFAIEAARRCARVYAVDVSKAMIAYAQAKAARAGTSNIVFCHGGFLTWQQPNEPADAIVTTFAFHHLPDFWKGVALKRMHRMLKSGGRLFLKDVIMDEARPLESIAAFIEEQTSAGGSFLREDAEQHFREEHSTYDWIMDGLFARAGFKVQSKKMHAGVIGEYLCSRTP